MCGCVDVYVFVWVCVHVCVHVEVYVCGFVRICVLFKCVCSASEQA
jgi:hypothetical protein